MTTSLLRPRTCAVAILAMVAVACTGTPPGQVSEAIVVDSTAPGSLETGGPTGDPLAVAEPSEDDSGPGDPASTPTGVTTLPSATTGGSSTSSNQTGAATTTGGTTDGGSTGGTTGGTTDGTTDGSTGGTGGGATGGGSTTTSGGEPQPSGPPEAPLYDEEQKYVGISDDRIHFCGHAALTFAEAFDTRIEDLNVYWEMVRDNGGIHGREVTVSWKDDAYSPDQAVSAAQACRAENPFMLLGGIGFDQIPAVRTWAEQNQMLYLHHMAIAPDRTYNFSYSAQPTVQDIGRAFGEYLVDRYRDRDIGILYRQSEFWEPGYRIGREVLTEAGANVVADLAVQKNQGVYSQQIAELQSRGAEIAWIWENALAASQIIKQAEQQGYRPKWVVFPFQTTLDVIGEASFDPTIDGVATWPAYARGGYGEDFAEYGLKAEIELFEATYARYRPNTKTNDILWQVWLGNKWLHTLLDQCGPDCNRNRIAGTFLSGWKVDIAPMCRTDFSHPGSFGGHIGGHEYFTQETFRTSGGAPAFKTTRWCSAHLN